MTIRLIRHGMTEANEKRLYCGITDLPLSEKGIEGLNLIKSELNFNKVGVYITSALKRTVQTMKILYGKEPDIIIEGFNEMNFGGFEMKSYSELKNEPGYISWITENENTRCPNGESRKMFSERVSREFEKLMQLDVESIAVVSHGGVIVNIMDRLFPNQKNFYEWQPGYGKGYTVKFDKGRAISWTD